ncbi:hypothetical protein NM208_g2387 [Fusarium decemcellulare]|uniref:Uncharacterized protein n=1 Tax=Fusarium decemcellulare TaxID=57161 RepID=A0ACC1SSX2_9HYPO|nr:hypothetical protein NM208_g2387 [Fusarium decemcellulare]
MECPRLIDPILMIASRHLGKHILSASCRSPAAKSSPEYLHGSTSVTDSAPQEADSAANLLLRFARIMEDKTSVAVGDTGWANLMLLHLADIIRYCFTDSKDIFQYDALLNDLTDWSQSKPDSFTPIYTCEHPDGRLFPEIWLYNESTAAGLQYYHLGRMLLMSHNPRLPKIGPTKSRAMKRIELEMKNDAKLVCAIADGMGQGNPTYLSACMAIALVGDLFDQHYEQDTLLDILTKTTTCIRARSVTTMTILQNAPYAVTISVLLVVYFLIYPIILHFRDPKGLRRFPNLSPLSGISNLPFMVIAHTGARSQYLARRHKDEAILRTGPNSLSFGSIKAIKDIYGHGTPCTKDEQYTLTAGTHFHLADVVNKPEHARKRKVLSAAYALKNLEEWEFKVADKVQRLINHFDKCATAPLKGREYPDVRDINVDFRAWTNFFSLDAIADIGLSERLGLLDQGHDIVEAQEKDGSLFQASLRDCLYPIARKQSLLVWSYDYYKIIDKLSNIIPYYNRMGSSCSHGWDCIVLRRAQLRLERYRAGEKLDDFFQSLMQDKNGNSHNLEWGEIVAELNIMMNAGSVTTAIALTNILYQLLLHPHILTKLREELDAALEPNEVIAPYEKVKHLPYLRACLDESLRLWPPTTHGLPRKTPPEGLNIMGHFIPGGTTVSISSLVAHRDESVFPDAEKFLPERFLGEKGKELQPYFLTFSAGARGCIGRNISYLEQTVCLASLVHSLEVPKRARQFPLLAYSILAFSSRQLVLITGIEDASSETYHSYALRILIPILDDPISSLDENVLAAVVLLRLYEEMSETDTGTHLLGGSRLLNDVPDFAAQGGLSEAASWIILRQNLHVSLIKSEPMRVNLDKYRHSRSFVDTTDEAFANRAVLLCCQVLAAAFGSGSQLDYDTWTQLSEEVVQWRSSIPAHYRPYYSDSDTAFTKANSVFPTFLDISTFV